jgi:hypothetical protein
MIAKINVTGTHVSKDGYLKVRIDLYPAPGDKTYPQQYVDIQDRPPTKEELDDLEKFKLIPTHKQLNPCLCHFVKIDPSMTLTQLRTQAKVIFDPVTLPQLDDALSRRDMLKLRQLLVNKCGTGSKLATGTNVETLINTIKTRFASLEVKV